MAGKKPPADSISIEALPMIYRRDSMLRLIQATIFIGIMSPALTAVPFYWESKSEEPGFTIDVPSLWSQASRARDRVANVHFERKDRAGRVAIEVRSYSSDNTEIDQLILQLRTRLAVKYDRVYLVARKELGFRKGLERQIWSARLGKKVYTLTTAFVVAEDKVLQLVCVSPANRKKEYEFVFDNALLSLDFSDGRPDAKAEPAAPEPAAAAPAALPAAPAVPGAPVAPPAAVKPKPPKIEF
jgi:hypothetical protein